MSTNAPTRWQPLEEWQQGNVASPPASNLVVHGGGGCARRGGDLRGGGGNSGGGGGGCGCGDGVQPLDLELAFEQRPEQAQE